MSKYKRLKNKDYRQKALRHISLCELNGYVDTWGNQGGRVALVYNRKKKKGEEKNELRKRKKKKAFLSYSQACFVSTK